MKNKRKNILLIAGMLLALLVGILAYSAYTQKQIYQESTANLLSTYGQSAKTFTMLLQSCREVLAGAVTSFSTGVIKVVTQASSGVWLTR